MSAAPAVAPAALFAAASAACVLLLRRRSARRGSQLLWPVTVREHLLTRSTPLFRVMQYNVLAPGRRYALADKHSYCPLQYRLWSYRYPRIRQIITYVDPDLLFLEETTAATFRDNFEPDFARRGYRCFHVVRDRVSEAQGSPRQSECLLVRVSDPSGRRRGFEVLSDAVVRFDELAPAMFEAQGWLHGAGGDEDPGARDLLNRMLACPDVAILVRLRHRGSGKELVAVGTHLHYHPRNPDVKVVQAFMLMHAVGEFQRQHGVPLGAPLVVGGDFNSLACKRSPDEYDPLLPPSAWLTSGVYSLMQDGVLATDHPDHPRQRSGAVSIPNLRTDMPLLSATVCASGREFDLTTKTSTFAGCLDFIFIRSPLLAVARAFVASLNTEHLCFPNAVQPSDHLPIAFDVAFMSMEAILTVPTETQAAESEEVEEERERAAKAAMEAQMAQTEEAPRCTQS